MEIPDGVGWERISEGLKELDVVGINHFSFGLPEGSEKFFEGMGKILELENVKKEKPTEWFIYPGGKTPGYEHLLWLRKEAFFHLEIDVKNSNEEIMEAFPEAIEEQPGMFWLTVDKNYLGILWAVIITNKRC